MKNLLMAFALVVALGVAPALADEVVETTNTVEVNSESVDDGHATMEKECTTVSENGEEVAVACEAEMEMDADVEVDADHDHTEDLHDAE